MEQIVLTPCKQYELQQVRDALQALLAPLGGMQRYVQPGQRVLLKPNMLAGKPPEAAVTTHPMIVQVVAEMVQAVGGVVLVGDSPGLGSLEKVAERSGILAAVRAVGGTLVAFAETVSVATSGVFKQLELSREYLEADVVINLPKLKTHEMMTLTCGVKNLYGTVVGAAKAGLHLTAGRSKEMFAGLLLEIAQARPVALTIVDGILAMEGNGPNSGTPRQLGWLLAGENMIALDLVAGKMVGIEAARLPVEQEAKQRQLVGAVWSDIQLCGPITQIPEVTPFRLPEGLDVQFGLPGFLSGMLRRYLTPLPIADSNQCILCGICRDACPPQAISMQKNALKVDSGRCIRCWCCRELCPHHALGVYRSPLLKLVEKI